MMQAHGVTEKFIETEGGTHGVVVPTFRPAFDFFDAVATDREGEEMSLRPGSDQSAFGD